MDERMGLVTHGRKLAWGWQHGFGRTWIPQGVLHAVVRLWNPLACRIWGHDWMPDFTTSERYVENALSVEHFGIKTELCTSCSAERPCRDEWRNP